MIFNRTQGKDIPPQAIKKSLATRALFVAYLELLTVASCRMVFFLRLIMLYVKNPRATKDNKRSKGHGELSGYKPTTESTKGVKNEWGM